MTDNKKLIKFVPAVSQKSITTSNQFSPITPNKPKQSYSTLVQTPQRFLSLTPLRPGSTSQKLSTRDSKVTPSISSASSSTQKEKFQYVVNPIIQRIKILEDFEVDLLNRSFHLLTDCLFGKGNTFYTDPRKTREYYQTILASTDSVHFTHNTNQREPSRIDYSKAKLIRILKPSDWPNPRSTEKALPDFPNYPRYNYYDYQEAWFKAFLLRGYSHSWFIFFDFKFECEYPRWFVDWFKYMGLLPDCLPNVISQGFTKFKTLFSQDVPDFEYLLQFSILFKIPWIMSWTFDYQEAKALSPPWLNRRFSVKWWEKFKLPQANQEAVIRYYQINYVNKAHLIQEPLDKDEDLVSRFQAAGSSREELQKLIQEIQGSSSSSPSGSTTDKELLQDAQDPFDDPYED